MKMWQDVGAQSGKLARYNQRRIMHHSNMIDPRHYGLIEMVLMFGIVIGFVVHQLWSLRDKGPKNDADSERD